MIKNNGISTKQVYELVISTSTPWEEVDEVEIISVMALLYDHNCPFSLMEMVMDEFVECDKALVFCGSLDKCQVGKQMFDAVNIDAVINEV